MTRDDGRSPPRTTLGPTPLKDAAFREAVGAVEWEVDARYAWDTGVAGSWAYRVITTRPSPRRSSTLTETSAP